jgi:hypothetical protein
MSPEEFQSHIVGAIRSALKAGVQGPFIFTVLHSQADNMLKLMKSEQPPPPPAPTDEPVIHLPPSR